jgi:preprotein translocase subunit SecD
MKVLTGHFNIYLVMAILLGLACGCQTSKKNLTAALRVHIEASPDLPDTSLQISVVRSDPVLMTIKREPFLTEANVIQAKIINAQGGFAIEVKFDENGSWLIEQYSAANPGRHFAIFCQWGKTVAEGRWLAAPFISRRISNGTLTFTPDCSREEADKLVPGLNETAKQIRKKS